MLPHEPEIMLSELSQLLAEKTGLYFSREHWKDMQRGIDAATEELGFKDVQSCMNGLLSSALTKTDLEILASYLTVGETYFFREPRNFKVIEKYILADIVRERRGNDQHLRIWSAGCATGEEPYTIAILLDKYLPDINDWNISILATDINPLFLQKASNGLYSKWSFRGVPERVKHDYFNTVSSGHFQIIPRIKQMVNFSYHNLAEDTYPSLTNGTNAMDLIFCRNVLMYFEPKRVKRVAEKLRHCLVEEGWLNVSSVETSNVYFSEFKPVNLERYTFYRKSNNDKKDVPVNEHEFSFDFVDTGSQIDKTDVSLFEEQGAALILPNPEPEEKAFIPLAAATAENDPYDEAGALFHAGQYAEATEKLITIVSEDPEDIRAIELLARCLANQGQLVQADEWCNKAIRINKLNAGCYYLLATVQHELGLIDEAIASLKRTLYLEPERLLAHFVLANHFKTQGKVEESIRHFENARALLDNYQAEDVLPESDGMTARRLREIIELTLRQEAA